MMRKDSLDIFMSKIGEVVKLKLKEVKSKQDFTIFTYQGVYK